MKFYEDIESVIEYIENNIMDVNLDEIPRIVGMPIGLYQRIFSYICGVSITEYIKKRRISLATQELIKGEKKVIDIAIAYGYQTHASFSRAFKEQMCMPPSFVRKSTCELKEYPRFSFQDNSDTYYVVKGRRIMAELTCIEYEIQEDKKVIGYQKRTDFPHAGQMWQEYFNNGFSDKIKEIERYDSDMGMGYISLGYMRDFDDSGTAFEYTIGKYFPQDTIEPEGLKSITIPSGLIAHGQIKGKLNDILEDAYFLLTEAIQKNGYKVDYDNFYWCDVYTFDGYCRPVEQGEEVVVLDYYMPCIKI